MLLQQKLFQKQEAMLYQIINDTFLLLELTGEGIIKDVNNRFLETMHYSFEDVVMQNYCNLTDGGRNDFRKTMDILSHGEQWQGESRFITKNREVKWLESTFIPIVNNKGTVEKIITLHQDITDAKFSEQWKKLAFRNELTGLPNRRSLLEAMDFAICRAQERNGQFAVLFMDLNRFKKVNDMYGHHIGDQLLIEVGRRLSEMHYANWELFHISGDEFVILLEDTVELDHMIESILMIFDRGFNFEISRFKVSVSIGVSLFPKHATTSERLIQLADYAMYEAKNSAHNQYRHAEQSFIVLRE